MAEEAHEKSIQSRGRCWLEVAKSCESDAIAGTAWRLSVLFVDDDLMCFESCLPAQFVRPCRNGMSKRPLGDGSSLSTSRATTWSPDQYMASVEKQLWNETARVLRAKV
jgi:hypothetical protein